MAASCAAETFTALAALHPNAANAKVTGMVIGKTDVRGFPDRKSVGSERFTFSFTLRDSPSCFMNAAAWGQEGYVRSLSDSFAVGACVTIENPLVQRKELEREEKFSPATPSDYKLLLSENHSRVSVRPSHQVDPRLLALARLPVRESRDCYSLGDIVANGRRLEGRTVNVLAAVRSVGAARHFTTADRRRGQRCEVQLFDESEPSFPLLCWDRESILLAQRWKPGQTVIFASDARINFDRFRDCMTATVTSKTIITADPDVPEARLLCSLLGDQGHGPGGPLPAALTSGADVYTVAQLKAEAGRRGGKAQPLLGTVFAHISALGLDGGDARLVRCSCAGCGCELGGAAGSGSGSGSCAACGRDPRGGPALVGFDLRLDLSDHTGTLRGCSLAGAAAEDALGCTAAQFLAMTDEQRTALKWRFLLERSKVHLRCSAAPGARGGLRASVLACQPADPEEASRRVSAQPGGAHAP